MRHSGQLPLPSRTEDGIYHLYALRYAGLERRAPDNFLFRDVHDGPMPLDYNVWIACNERRTVLIDTGFGPEAAERRGRPVSCDPIEALERIGVAVDAIEDVIITHLHYDHAGNMGRFASARFHVQAAEAAFATGRHMAAPHLRAPYDVNDVVAFVRHVFAERVRFHEGDADALPGISLRLMPGHSAGMQAVSIATPRGRVLLASDVSHFYSNFVRRSPFPITIDLPATLDAYAKLREVGGSIDRIVPGHDPLVRTHYPSLSVGGVELSVLHEPPTPFDEERIAACEEYRHVCDPHAPSAGT